MSTDAAPALCSPGSIQVIQTAIRPDCTVDELADVASASPELALRVLSRVNSAAFGLSREISSVQHAAAMLGRRRMRNLALALAVSDMAPAGPASDAVLTASVRRAAAGTALAEATGLADPSLLFTVGLLLEIGLLDLSVKRPELALEIASSPAADRLVRERAVGVVPHPEVGASIAEHFGLSGALVEAIRSHHQAEPPPEDSARVAWLAERVAGVFEGGQPARARDAAVEAAETIGVRGSVVDEVLEELPERFRDVAPMMDRDLGATVDLETLTLDANRSLVDMCDQYEEVIARLEAVIAEKDALARELEEANERLSSLARSDALTGLPNKRALTEALTRSLARIDRSGGTLSLVVIDVDHFKKFNDTWGHQVGDEVLRVVGRVLAESLRDGDFAGRYGGEEFVILLPDTDRRGAAKAAERIRVRLEHAGIDGPEGRLSVTASFGVASAHGPGCKGAAAKLFERADAALYEAKRRGRNQVALAA